MRQQRRAMIYCWLPAPSKTCLSVSGALRLWSCTRPPSLLCQQITLGCGTAGNASVPHCLRSSWPLNGVPQFGLLGTNRPQRGDQVFNLSVIEPVLMGLDPTHLGRLVGGIQFGSQFHTCSWPHPTIRIALAAPSWHSASTGRIPSADDTVSVARRLSDCAGPPKATT